MTCSCALERYEGPTPVLEGFAVVRRNCPALREILLPDESWELVSDQMSVPSDDAGHQSYLLLAYERGVLSKITAPVHRFLLAGASPHPNLTPQYRHDLQERWLVDVDPVSRHERFRQFFGKIVELQVVQAITNRGWTVTGLEALGAHADVVALSPENTLYSLEVKYIGQETDHFQTVLRALAGQPAAGVGSPYGAVNYLLFRVYEAARRLQLSSTSRIAVVVIDALAWHAFEAQLEDRWVRWNQPAFLAADGEWAQFLQSQRARYPHIDADLSDVVRTLDRIWVLRMDSQYECVLEYDERPAG